MWIIREWETPGPHSQREPHAFTIELNEPTMGSSEDDPSQQWQGRALQSEHSPAPHQINISPHTEVCLPQVLLSDMCLTSNKKMISHAQMEEKHSLKKASIKTRFNYDTAIEIIT